MRLPWTRDWELIDKTVLPSGIEQTAKAGMSGKINGDIFSKTLVLTFKCKLTGRIRIKEIRTWC